MLGRAAILHWIKLDLAPHLNGLALSVWLPTFPTLAMLGPPTHFHLLGHSSAEQQAA